MIFPTQKSFFFRAARQAAVDTVKEEIPANPSNRHSPISEKPKNHFFPGSLPSSSRQRKKGEIPANPSNRFRNVIFPTQKSFFARTPQKKKSQQIPAIATLQFYRPSSNRQCKKGEIPANFQSPLSNFTKMIFQTQKSFFCRAARQAAVDTAKEEIPANPSNRHSPISEKSFSPPKNHFFPRHSAKQQ